MMTAPQTVAPAMRRAKEQIVQQKVARMTRDAVLPMMNAPQTVAAAMRRVRERIAQWKAAPARQQGALAAPV